MKVITNWFMNYLLKTKLVPESCHSLSNKPIPNTTHKHSTINKITTHIWQRIVASVCFMNDKLDLCDCVATYARDSCNHMNKGQTKKEKHDMGQRWFKICLIWY